MYGPRARPQCPDRDTGTHVCAAYTYTLQLYGYGCNGLHKPYSWRDVACAPPRALGLSFNCNVFSDIFRVHTSHSTRSPKRTMRIPSHHSDTLHDNTITKHVQKCRPSRAHVVPTTLP